MVNFILHRKIASIFAFVLLIILFWSSTALQDIFFDAVFYIESYFQNHQILGVFAFIGLAAVSSMLSPFSSVPIVPIAIIMWGNFWSIIFLVTGWLIGHIITYTVGYYAGYPIAKNFVPFDRIDYYSKKLSKKSEFFLILFFRLSMPAEVPGYVLGIVRYNFIKYFLVTLIAEFPFAILTVYGGGAFINKDLPVLAGVLIIGVATISIMFYFFRKKIRQNNQTL